MSIYKSCKKIFARQDRFYKYHDMSMELIGNPHSKEGGELKKAITLKMMHDDVPWSPRLYRRFLKFF